MGTSPPNLYSTHPGSPGRGAAPLTARGVAHRGGDTASLACPVARALPGWAGGGCGVEVGTGRAGAAALRSTAPCAGSRPQSGSVHSPGGGKGSQGWPVPPDSPSPPPRHPVSEEG